MMKTMTEEERQARDAKRERFRSLVLVNEIGQFWSGRKWVTEYPDAALYTSLTSAKQDRMKALFKAVRVSIRGRYGYADEYEVSS